MRKIRLTAIKLPSLPHKVWWTLIPCLLYLSTKLRRNGRISPGQRLDHAPTTGQRLNAKRGCRAQWCVLPCNIYLATPVACLVLPCNTAVCVKYIDLVSLQHRSSSCRAHDPSTATPRSSTCRAHDSSSGTSEKRRPVSHTLTWAGFLYYYVLYGVKYIDPVTLALLQIQ